jgi:RHS repeat-associated protein
LTGGFYQYDAIHRTTGITYPSSGPDASVTQSKTFVYDSATYNGTAMSNPKGRLVEAYTGASGSKTTDEFFSYSVRGELTDTYQCTPHSGTNGCASVSNYYHVTAGFWENGALKTLSSSISGLPSANYGVDPMGRTNAVTTPSGGQNPINTNGVTYDLANYKTTVTYGSGDSDVVQLDQYTGRMTKYTFNVGSSNSDVGQTTWNPNGSLKTLQVTDTVTSTVDTQTCSYSHDDLSRISSVNCLNGATNKWNQAFTYDAFGNITKTTNGPGVGFGPTYDTSKNWITNLPGKTTTTDNNGQMTYDGVHNYTWDAEGKMHSVDAIPATCSTSGECLTYDALGRMVEKTVGSTYMQIVYGPQGRFATMNGQTTLVSAFIPLPGAQAVYTGASLITTNKVAYYRHADHLGSSRLATTPTQTLYSSTAYAPYGEPYSQAGTTDLSFTGQDQDTVSGIHDFLFRKYPPVQGRWLSPDPAGLGAVDPASPQSWNRYAYVVNNPLPLIDPLGLDPCDIDSGSWECLWGKYDPSQPSPGVGASQSPDLASITGSGGECASDTACYAQKNFAYEDCYFNNPSGSPCDLPTDPYDNDPFYCYHRQNGTESPQVFCLFFLSTPRGPPRDWKPGFGVRVGGHLDLSPQAIKCTGSGIGTLMLDYAGFIPGEGVAHALFGIALGMVSTPISAHQGNMLGTFGGIAGIHLSALELTANQVIKKINPLLNFRPNDLR